MKVGEIMHAPVVTCRQSASVRDLAHLMQHQNVGSVLVVDDEGLLVGIVTDRDIVIRAVAEAAGADAAATDVMTKRPATATIDTDRDQALRVMAERAVRRLPVVGHDGRPRGMVTFDDLIVELGRETNKFVEALILQGSWGAR